MKSGKKGVEVYIFILIIKSKQNIQLYCPIDEIEINLVIYQIESNKLYFIQKLMERKYNFFKNQIEKKIKKENE